MAEASELVGEYIGDELPKWVAAGVRLRVKRTSITRAHGLRIRTDSQDRTWPGEVGVVRAQQGNGWWGWVVDFPRGLTYRLDKTTLADLVRVPGLWFPGAPVPPAAPEKPERRFRVYSEIDRGEGATPRYYGGYTHFMSMTRAEAERDAASERGKPYIRPGSVEIRELET
jgi:hypothetical protein